MKINPKFIVTTHQVHVQSMHSSSSNTEGNVVKIYSISSGDNVQKKCKTSLTSFLSLFASTV